MTIYKNNVIIKNRVVAKSITKNKEFDMRAQDVPGILITEVGREFGGERMVRGVARVNGLWIADSFHFPRLNVLLVEMKSSTDKMSYLFLFDQARPTAQHGIVLSDAIFSIRAGWHANVGTWALGKGRQMVEEIVLNMKQDRVHSRMAAFHVVYYLMTRIYGLNQEPEYKPETCHECDLYPEKNYDTKPPE
ncbi:MAG: hypothetical protein WC757_02430 [Candidatus Paceibacterota bacterium]